VRLKNIRNIRIFPVVVIFAYWPFNIYLCASFGENLVKNINKMKKDIHPNYREVVFLDTSSGYKFMTRSTVDTSDTIEWEDGNSYPLVKVEVSSASHPFFTGKKVFLDTAGRVEKFIKKYKKK
jgi:large subunit ribosomal protein L31